MKVICSIFVNRKFVEASSKINVENNCKFLSLDSVLLNLCCIPFLEKISFLEISVFLLVDYPLKCQGTLLPSQTPR